MSPRRAVERTLDDFSIRYCGSFLAICLSTSSLDRITAKIRNVWPKLNIREWYSRFGSARIQIAAIETQKTITSAGFADITSRSAHSSVLNFPVRRKKANASGITTPSETASEHGGAL
eukprot:g29898.t1